MSEGPWISWAKSKLLLGRLSAAGAVENRGGKLYFEGRHVITRDSPIDGGVYLGASPREAIVVDSEKYPSINQVYEEAKEKARRGGKVQRELVLRAVYDTVREVFPNSGGCDHKVDDLLRKMGVGPDEKVSLDRFIEARLGICRHHALLSAVLLEKFKADPSLTEGERVRGKISVDRNETGKGGHAWCRYTTYDGEVFILDSALGYFGALKEADPEKFWLYKRPGDG